MFRCVRAGSVLLLLAAAAPPASAWSPTALFEPCHGDCGTAVFAGSYVETGMGDIITGMTPPTSWDFRNDHLVGLSLSRRAGHLWVFDLEPEVGVAQRFGLQDETELWGALYFRYRGFPWDRWLLTTVGFSTGMNWASDISDVEQQRAHDGEGSQWMHYFSPEITFAAPSHPDTELLIRFHHRSGVFGLVSDAIGGDQYLTMGLRVRF